MTAEQKVKSKWSRYRPVLRFLAKAVAVYGAWYVLYDLWLLPDGRLDAWMSQAAASVTGTTLSGLGLDVAVEGRTVQVARAAGVRIIDACNGLTTIGAFIGFIVAYPGETKRRFWFIPLGIAAIFLANVGRVSVLASSQAYWPAAFSSLHGMPTRAPFHLTVFGLWVLWAQYGGSSSDTDARTEPETSTSTVSADV
ncbi:exosortase/archaeosortase family protein [Salinibacter ruber]|uniref:Exosortase/archaeosortase family protein n=1 Tax=Salinibacter ruber TaxID=146919 RepID=A0A9X2REV6_9BACT|nr:exosortase/archaeosortase family protein [Salinibacter ruber]MCS3857812.1 exosortase/archaeosortase family protein [Salinibacter ruber]MCS3864638.1 exosortase/archaeosortase family protein [Salinibacter ruber]